MSEKADQYVKLKVVDTSGEELTFRVNKTDRLSRVTRAYRKRKQKAEGTTITFSYQGNRLNQTKTPAYYEMKDGDVIDANISQHGGGFW